VIRAQRLSAGESAMKVGFSEKTGLDIDVHDQFAPNITPSEK